MTRNHFHIVVALAVAWSAASSGSVSAQETPPEPPAPVQPDASPQPERAEKEPKGSFAGDNLPDPEPVPS